MRPETRHGATGRGRAKVRQVGEAEPVGQGAAPAPAHVAGRAAGVAPGVRRQIRGQTPACATTTPSAPLLVGRFVGNRPGAAIKPCQINVLLGRLDGRCLRQPAAPPRERSGMGRASPASPVRAAAWLALVQRPGGDAGHPFPCAADSTVHPPLRDPCDSRLPARPAAGRTPPARAGEAHLSQRQPIAEETWWLRCHAFASSANPTAAPSSLAVC
jgi:hypothetical protein